MCTNRYKRLWVFASVFIWFLPIHIKGAELKNTRSYLSYETTIWDVETSIYKGTCQGNDLIIEIQGKDHLGNLYGCIEFASGKRLVFVCCEIGTTSKLLMKVLRPSDPALFGEYLEWKAYLEMNVHGKIQLSVFKGLSFIEKTKYKLPHEGAVCTLEPVGIVQKESVDERIKAFVLDFCMLSETCDRNLVYKLYAPKVNRYHDSYNTNVDHVADCYANYDTKFGVYGKHSQARWEPLNYSRTNNGFIVTYIEDYSIDRYDISKWSVFVLRKHIELDDNFQIISVYDDQISRSK